MKSREINVVYLGLLPPQSKSEGLNVLLSDTIIAFINIGVSVNIYTTDRHSTKIEEALVGNGVDISLVKFHVYSVGSWVLKFFSRFYTAKIDKKTYFFHKLQKLVGGLLDRIVKSGLKAFFWAIDGTALVAPFNIFIFVTFLALLLMLVLPPVFLISFLISAGMLIFLTTKKIFSWAKTRVSLRGILIKPFYSIAKSTFLNFKYRLAVNLYLNEQLRFAEELNRKNVTRLLFFTAFDGDVVAKVRAKTIVVFPDAVGLVFPLRFAGHVSEWQINSMRKAIRYANGVVCYSQFVRDSQLFKFFGPEALGKEIVVISQGYFKSKSNDFVDAINNELNKNKKLIKNFFPNLLRHPPTVHFGYFKYIVYPTVDRPHKNLPTLIKAFNILLRRYHLNVKLIFTSPGITNDTRILINAERLQYDVLFMPDLTSDFLNLLLGGASLMVHPSLAEGGDIFNFSRAVALACPALLGDIPVAREMFDRASIGVQDYEPWLFDVGDSEALAEKMRRVLHDGGKTLKRQVLHLDQLATYDFETMASNYYSFYDRIL